MTTIKNEPYIKETLSNANTNSGGYADRIASDAREVKGDLDSLKNNIVGMAHKAIDASSDGVSDAKKMAVAEFDKLRTASANGLKRTEERIRDKPAQSIAIAFLAGVLVNAVFGRK
jgi:ElaB/YqjD/DUF883 family membrane-anchored ribosome-binding protein